MARIAGVDLPKDKRVEIGLTYIYGIGRTSANKILAETGINPDTRVKDLTEEEESKLRECMEHYVVEGDLRRQTALLNVMFLFGSWKSSPVRYAAHRSLSRWASIRPQNTSRDAQNSILNAMHSRMNCNPCQPRNRPLRPK